ncbi:MAG: hypothetical protein PUF61_05415 [Spirochaetales bacterium]|nr:hypothetical protein [Spirochaetales bacterium]
MKRPSQFSSDKRQATSDKRQATSDKRQATSDKRLNSLTNLFVALTAIILAITLSACGGGGGGGGGVSFTKTSKDGIHNGGDSGGWGKGIETTTSSSSSSLGRLPQEELDEELLFSAFPTFFSPIDHIDITLYINDTLVEGLTGLNASTKKEVIPEIKVGDKIHGSAKVTLQDGSVRNARLEKTSGGIDSTKLAFITEYKYRIMTGAGTAGAEGIFTTAESVDVSAFVPGTVYGLSSDLNVSAFSDGTDTFTVSGGRLNLTKGDKILSPVFNSELSIVCDGTGVTPYNGADSYVFDYAQNTSGVTLTIPVPALPGVTITGTVDGNAVTLNGGGSAYTTTLLPGAHNVSLSMNGGSDFAGSGQTLSKTISVYVKPDIKIKEIATGNKIVYDSTNDVYKFRSTVYGLDMPVEVVSDAATTLPNVTMTNTYLDNVPITATTTAENNTTHTIKADFTGYCVNSVNKTVSVKMKPVKVTVPSVTAFVTRDQGVRLFLSVELYIEGKNDGTDTGRQTIKAWAETSDNSGYLSKTLTTNSSSNYVNLTDTDSTFYFYTSLADDTSDSAVSCGRVNKGHEETTRTLADLLGNQSFNSDYVNSSGNKCGNSGRRARFQFTVSLDDSAP